MGQITQPVTIYTTIRWRAAREAYLAISKLGSIRSDPVMRDLWEGHRELMTLKVLGHRHRGDNENTLATLWRLFPRYGYIKGGFNQAEDYVVSQRAEENTFKAWALNNIADDFDDPDYVGRLAYTVEIIFAWVDKDKVKHPVTGELVKGVIVADVGLVTVDRLITTPKLVRKLKETASLFEASSDEQRPQLLSNILTLTADDNSEVVRGGDKTPVQIYWRFNYPPEPDWERAEVLLDVSRKDWEFVRKMWNRMLTQTG